MSKSERNNIFARGWRSVRARTRLSIPQLAATALAAITMAVVSSRLSSFSSSILIAGLIAVVSAVSSEFYRILIDTGAEKTKEVVAPVLSEAGRHEDNAEAMSAQAQAAGAPTQELPTVSTSDTKPSSEADGAGAPGAANHAGLHDADEVDDIAAERPKRKVASALVSALAHNQVAQMSLVFFLVALVTIGVSYGVARAQGGTHYNSFTTVTQSLTDEEKQALLDEAAEQANAKGSGSENPAETAEGSTDSNPDASTAQEETAEKPGDTNGETDMAAEIARLQQENESLQDSVDELATKLATEQDTISNLLARLEALESQLAQQGAPPSTQTDPGAE